ncbi:GGDEF domain-containing protein [Aliikangiella coralliicola]|uniref:diguanylate cyclase n=1 Tax=Aliikangiella coralliicola TaxID=2592383 RepID=A0A545UBW3_9GAMM|nr:diguanylate cyclase [Aliikangiella coralliicola]TQV86947.1 diguanylate cyclase [Aliikangiella coralliicola]
MFKNIVLWTILLFSQFLLAEESPKSVLPLHLEQGWKFCPVQNYQPNVDVDVLDCQPITLPAGWESVYPGYDGYALIYTQFTLPKSVEKEPLGIYISKIRDADKTYINNQLIGETGEFPPEFDKAVLYSRLYAIPKETLKFGQENTIHFWIYNDARPGGLTQSVPVIDTHHQLLDNFYTNNYRALAFILVLAIFGLLHFVYYLFNRLSSENLYYSLFLFVWSVYLYTYSDLAIASDLPMSLLFRTNVALFFAIFSLLPLFIFKFFQQPLPLFLKLLIGLSAALIPICFLLPEDRLLYYPLEVIEVLTLPALIPIYWLLIKVVKAKMAYARLMTLVLVLYTTLGSVDIFLDFVQSEALNRVFLYGPWALLVLSFVLTLIVAHKNLVYYRDATWDRLTATLRFNEFSDRLEQELLRADRANKPMVIIMIDLDNFKYINDHYGHMQGDKVLQLVSQSLRGQLRHFDLLGRYGGDEFCVAATLEHEQEIKGFVNRLHKNINQQTFKKKGQIEHIEATFGATIRKANETISAKSLIEKADTLLIKAKASDKGTVMW